MTRLSRRSVLALMGTGALSACTTPSTMTDTASGPLAFAEQDPFEGGIGGTGIVGVMTDFGSLIVNGLRVETDRSTRIISPFGPVAEDDLAPGMALTVLAERSRDGLVARRVAVDYALVGTAMRGANGVLTVNGVAVRPEPGVIGQARDGERLVVSGLWSPSGLVASRFDAAPHDQDLVAGTVQHGGPTGLTVSGVPVSMSGQRPSNGEYAVARGRFGDGALDASSLTVGRFGSAPSLRQLSVEGYLEPVAAAPGYRVAGLGHSFATDVRLQPLAGSRAIYFGPYDGRFAASAGYVLPESFSQRRTLLARGFDQGFDGTIIPTR